LVLVAKYWHDCPASSELHTYVAVGQGGT